MLCFFSAESEHLFCIFFLRSEMTLRLFNIHVVMSVFPRGYKCQKLVQNTTGMFQRRYINCPHQKCIIKFKELVLICKLFQTGIFSLTAFNSSSEHYFKAFSLQTFNYTTHDFSKKMLIVAITKLNQTDFSKCIWISV